MVEESGSPLVASFLAALTPQKRARLEGVDGLEGALWQALAEGREAWPGVQLDDETFVTYLAERVGDDPVDETDPLRDVASLRTTELYLACACCRGDDAALAAFTTRFKPELNGALGRLDLTPAQAEEVKQIFQQQLVVSGGDRQPTLAKYAGRGALGGWLRVSITRLALRQLGKGKRELALEDDLLEVLPTPENDPELDYLKDLYREEFRSAFETAMASLTPRQRNLLRHQFVDRLGIDQIGSLYRVHRSTAARWLEAARQHIVEQIRHSMMQRLRIRGDEYESIMRLIHSQVNLSITRHLDPGRE